MSHGPEPGHSQCTLGGKGRKPEQVEAEPDKQRDSKNDLDQALHLTNEKPEVCVDSECPGSGRPGLQGGPDPSLGLRSISTRVPLCWRQLLPATGSLLPCAGSLISSDEPDFLRLAHSQLRTRSGARPPSRPCHPTPRCPPGFPDASPAQPGFSPSPWAPCPLLTLSGHE